MTFESVLHRLKFVYFLKVKKEIKEYIIENPQILKTPDSLKGDVLKKAKFEYVQDIIKKLKKHRNNTCPFKDKRKQTFKGMTPLESGDKYQGTWVENDQGELIIHGRGLYIYSNGSQYIGWFNEGEIVGMARIVYHNGDIYEGLTKDSKYTGNSKYIFGESHPISGFYEGEFKNNQITG
eukprot:CAMPEP_0197015190 /NCGR_PEP_ID=MMETSP1380-20130617/73221_1 /TAXON_ID=5936 /ORGANISM="Euplotes crassus, Strain CT5" /LENGTH=178 /DNA_ID=CAMNT_0042440921 /DNA_START=107 /DNA_END=640 /DNA_ORIENTATION=+